MSMSGFTADASLFKSASGYLLLDVPLLWDVGVSQEAPTVGITALEHFHADWNLIPIHGTARM